jgi:hypothetical protein
MTEQWMFPAGKYYIGDPCYAIKDENWIPLLDDTGYLGLHKEKENGEPLVNWDDGLFSYRFRTCFAHGTAYGDGCYMSNTGLEFGVDAGLLSIIPFDVVDGDSIHGGNIVDFNNCFMVWEEDGTFHFGNIVIPTKDEPEYEEEYWDEDEQEDEDEMG